MFGAFTDRVCLLGRSVQELLNSVGRALMCRLTWAITRRATSGRSWVTRLARTSSTTRVVPSPIPTSHSPSHCDVSPPSTTTCSSCPVSSSPFSRSSSSGCRPSRPPRWCSVPGNRCYRRQIKSDQIKFISKCKNSAHSKRVMHLGVQQGV